MVFSFRIVFRIGLGDESSRCWNCVLNTIFNLSFTFLAATILLTRAHREINLLRLPHAALSFLGLSSFSFFLDCFAFTFTFTYWFFKFRGARDNFPIPRNGKRNSANDHCKSLLVLCVIQSLCWVAIAVQWPVLRVDIGRFRNNKRTRVVECRSRQRLLRGFSPKDLATSRNGTASQSVKRACPL